MLEIKKKYFSPLLNIPKNDGANKRLVTKSSKQLELDISTFVNQITTKKKELAVSFIATFNPQSANITIWINLINVYDPKSLNIRVYLIHNIHISATINAFISEISCANIYSP